MEDDVVSLQESCNGRDFMEGSPFEEAMRGVRQYSPVTRKPPRRGSRALPRMWAMGSLGSFNRQRLVEDADSTLPVGSPTEERVRGSLYVPPTPQAGRRRRRLSSVSLSVKDAEEALNQLTRRSREGSRLALTPSTPSQDMERQRSLGAAIPQSGRQTPAGGVEVGNASRDIPAVPVVPLQFKPRSRRNSIVPGSVPTGATNSNIVAAAAAAVATMRQSTSSAGAGRPRSTTPSASTVDTALNRTAPVMGSSSAGAANPLPIPGAHGSNSLRRPTVRERSLSLSGTRAADSDPAGRRAPPPLPTGLARLAQPTRAPAPPFSLAPVGTVADRTRAVQRDAPAASATTAAASLAARRSVTPPAAEAGCAHRVSSRAEGGEATAPSSGGTRTASDGPATAATHTTPSRALRLLFPTTSASPPARPGLSPTAALSPSPPAGTVLVADPRAAATRSHDPTPPVTARGGVAQQQTTSAVPTLRRGADVVAADSSPVPRDSPTVRVGGDGRSHARGGLVASTVDCSPPESPSAHGAGVGRTASAAPPRHQTSPAPHPAPPPATVAQQRAPVGPVAVAPLPRPPRTPAQETGVRTVWSARPPPPPLGVGGPPANGSHPTCANGEGSFTSPVRKGDATVRARSPSKRTTPTTAARVPYASGKGQASSWETAHYGSLPRGSGYALEGAATRVPVTPTDDYFSFGLSPLTPLIPPSGHPVVAGKSAKRGGSAGSSEEARKQLRTSLASTSRPCDYWDWYEMPPAAASPRSVIAPTKTSVTRKRSDAADEPPSASGGTPARATNVHNSDSVMKNAGESVDKGSDGLFSPHCSLY